MTEQNPLPGHSPPAFFQEDIMVRGFILWLLGVPLVGIVILYVLGYL